MPDERTAIGRIREPILLPQGGPNASATLPPHEPDGIDARPRISAAAQGASVAPAVAPTAVAAGMADAMATAVPGEASGAAPSATAATMLAAAPASAPASALASAPAPPRARSSAVVAAGAQPLAARFSAATAASGLGTAPAGLPGGFGSSGLGSAAVGPGAPGDEADAADDDDVPDGTVLDMALLKRAGLALAGMRSRTTEEYRITVGRILRLLSGERGADGAAPAAPAIAGSRMAQMIMLTSSRPGEGKSFTALNISASIAQNGLADVLLVDVDGKPRSLTTLLGLRERQGLLDLVGNPTLRPKDVVLRTAIPGLAIMPLGLNRSATAEGGVTRAVLGVLDRVRRRFPRHIVLLDTAPCLSTSDPSTLAPAVDQVVLVVEAGRTRQSELSAALELVRACPNVVLVLNKVRLSHRHSFGSYYYFGYPS